MDNKEKRWKEFSEGRKPYYGWKEEDYFEYVIWNHHAHSTKIVYQRAIQTKFKDDDTKLVTIFHLPVSRFVLDL